MQGKKHLILIAYAQSKPVGFKVGYDKEGDGSFYSWMGGVLPEYRQQQVGKQLAQKQETWARENGFTSIRFKTRNRHKAMLLFALKNDFQIISVEIRETVEEYRIVLQKRLWGVSECCFGKYNKK
ncbi:GNAT family N-acetyltransferase [Rhodocytophaga rosea]|uniref:GNAT family N-acetyltransferase n=1 Tax=Rhodocytophaga rosea TaxID=2704465 RepID=UPI00293C0513|nr:GNAT family N-acetyltransferase [Rhodocytophaga rosea]